MIQTLEAMIAPQGNVRLLQPLHISSPSRALVTVHDEEPMDMGESALLSQAALAEDWNRNEEDEAWAHLQPAQS